MVEPQLFLETRLPQPCLPALSNAWRSCVRLVLMGQPVTPWASGGNASDVVINERHSLKVGVEGGLNLPVP